jgi:hypothetical protein
VLFGIVRAKGFDEAYIDCYRMVTAFYQSRTPLCIIIGGTSWTGARRGRGACGAAAWCWVLGAACMACRCHVCCLAMIC